MNIAIKASATLPVCPLREASRPVCRPVCRTRQAIGGLHKKGLKTDKLILI